LPRVLVAQIGARRGYAVPRGLSAAGSLYRLVVDACEGVAPWKYFRRVPQRLRPSALRAALNRRVDGVPSELIQGSLSFFLSTRLGTLRARPGEPKATFWVRQNEAFGRSVAKLDWGRADTVYAFNGAALEVFAAARRRGLRCILDQTAAPWRYNSGLLRREQAQWPGWEECPADVDPTGLMIAREEKEWELADQIVCGSPFVLDAMRQVGGPSGKCRVIPYPTPTVPASGCRQRTSGNQPLKVLFVGTLQLRKGIQYLWDAAGRLPSDRFEFRAIGPSLLTRDAEHRVLARMNWRGPVGRDRVWEHYRWADVFILPTLSEGSANVCLEAAAAGLPVITSAAAGITDSTVPNVVVDRVSSETIAARLSVRAGLSTPAEHDDPRLERRSLADYGRELAMSCC
jgi:glycosyltransferase involved in cell wall biosynthesis